MLYLWLKAFHVIAIIAWMAALLYLPRLLVYHAETQPGTPASETFKVMERRLLKAIATPSMTASWVLGLTVAYMGGWFVSGWLHAKLLFVVLLSAYHGVAARWVREFAEDRNKRSSRFYRVVNELPALAMVVIVILVVVKPF